MTRPLFRFLNDIILKLNNALTVRKYDNFTIAKYFRKQGIQVGENCYIVPRTFGTEPYLIKIGNHVFIAQGAHLNTHDGGTWVFRKEIPDLRVFGPIVIGDNCVIGENAIIQPNVTIGENSIVAAGSLVIADVPPNSIVAGVPARRFGSLEKYKEKCIDRWAVQKPPELTEDIGDHFLKSPHKDLILSKLRNHLTKIFYEKLH